MNDEDFKAETANAIAVLNAGIQLQFDTAKKALVAIVAVQESYFQTLATALKNVGIPVPEPPELPELDLRPFDFEAALAASREKVRHSLFADTDKILNLEVIE